MNSDSDSDYDDPDKVEVPGGGKNLYSLVSTENQFKENSNDLASRCSTQTNTVQANDRLSGSTSVLPFSDYLCSSGFPGTLSTGYFDSYLSNQIGRQHKMIKNLPSTTGIQYQLAFDNNNGGYINNYSGQTVGTSQTAGLVLTPNNINNEADNEEEGMGVAETYANYMPSKLNIGCRHPDPVVESTSLSSVEPVEVWYKLVIPDHVITSGSLSALQLEAITYACQQHEKKLPDGSRAGFLIGDGAGVGKGRTIAGIIYENYLRGRKKAIWISVMGDLKEDAERDLTDIGASISVYSLNKYKYSKLDSPENGKIKKGVIFCTYSAIIAKTSQVGSEFETRIDQLVDWCGNNFNGALIFDECHKAKNLSYSGAGKSTKTGQIVLDLQQRLPNSRVVYASATGATEPKNMAYMVRLGMWGNGTPYKDFSEFLAILQRRGVGAMEIVAMDMKLRGLYIARQLSFHGVIFKIHEVRLNPQFRKVYDKATEFWAEAYENFSNAINTLRMEKSSVTMIWSQFWCAHQRFFKYMCIAAKVKEAVYLAREAIKCGKCVVIGLQSTGEAMTLDHIEKEKGDKELTDFVSTAQGVLRTLVKKHFPDPPQKYSFSHNSESSYNNKKRSKVKPPKKKCKVIWDIKFSDETESDSDSSNTESDPFLDYSFEALNNPKFLNLYEMKIELLKKIDNLGKVLPPNSLDELIDELGGPDNVAEMTGRKGRIIHSDGNFKYTSRSEAESSLDTMNLMEKQRFMNGEKDVAIISEAASSGISLHSDRRAINRKCRVHITLELPWSADKAIQQFGRTHRSNQVNAPEYVLLISDLGGERRFASVVAKRLESLGALTQGDRRATEARDLSKFNIDNNYGRMAVEITLKSLLNSKKHERLVSPPNWYKGDFVKDAQDGLKKVGLLTSSDEKELILESDKKSLGKFLNRILGLPVNLQNALFEYFTDTMDAVIEKAKKSGDFDLGILDVATSDQSLVKISVHRFIKQHITGTAAAELYKVSAERGMSWKEAERLCERATIESKFYVSPLRNGKKEVLLAVAEENSTSEASFCIYRPNLGKQVRKEVLSSILRKYSPADVKEAQEYWTLRYLASIDTCSHKYWGGICKRSLRGETCDVGLRRKMYYILSGSVLSVWNIVEEIISKVSKLQVVRIKTTDGAKIVGTLVPASCVERLITVLSIDSEEVISQKF